MGSDNPGNAALTYNKTIFMNGDQSIPEINYIDPFLSPANVTLFQNCIPTDYVTINNDLGGESYPKPPLLMFPARKHDYRFDNSYRNYNYFEHVNWFPNQVLIAYHYDELPLTNTTDFGIIWKYFNETPWNDIAPLGEVRNLKGKISAIAYRETGTQPYNYMVFSYDERGRIEALMRYTDNLGYDAVYYTYNSMNLVTSVQTIDPQRSYITYYGYDDAGRINNVWSELLDDNLNGLCNNTGNWTPVVPSYPLADVVYNPASSINNVNNPTAIRGASISPDITYTYEGRDLISAMNYPQISTYVSYSYNNRMWLSSMTSVTTNPYNLFIESPDYENNGTGLINYVESSQNSQTITQNFTYDGLRRLQTEDYQYPGAKQTKSYLYDKIGNKIFSEKNCDFDGTDWYEYNNGNNQLTDFTIYENTGFEYVYYAKNCYNYNTNGALIASRKNWLNQDEKWDSKYEDFKYDTRGLPERYRVANYVDQDSYTCEFFPKDEEDLTEWHYKYNPMNEREQKRMYERATAGVTVPGIMAAKGPISEFFPRAYYLLGWNNEQFAVYYGAEYEPAVQSINCVGGGTANITSDGPRTVLMWNAEYNTYGNGSNINLTYKYDEDGTWKKYYNINDRLGNVRTVLRKDGTAGTPVKQFFYTPFGSVIPLLGDVNRTKFIGKEKDKESNYADHGVRKYDDEIGRFTSIDPLWELDYSWTPYHYSYNNPVLFTDGNGMQPGVLTQPIKDLSKLIGPAAIAIGTNPQVQKVAEKSLDYIKEKVNQLDNFLSNGGYENSENYQPESIIQTDATSVSPPDPIILKEKKSETKENSSNINERSDSKPQEENNNTIIKREHTKNARQSTKHDHQIGKARLNQKNTDKKRQKQDWQQNPNKRKTQ